MYKIKTNEHFDKKYRKLVSKNKSLIKKIAKAVEMLRINPHHNSLKTHKVDTKISDSVYSSWVTGDIRIIWEFGDGELILIFIDIGGHSGANKVYK